jgi:hypothetical protein
LREIALKYDKMSVNPKKLTIKQAKFAEEYLETGNATEAANRAYKPQKRATARAMGSENLTKPNIRAYLEERAADAVSMVFWLSQKAQSENVRLNACRDILDRAGYFVDKTQIAEANQKLPIPIMGGLSISREIAEKNGIFLKISDKEKGGIEGI